MNLLVDINVFMDVLQARQGVRSSLRTIAILSFPLSGHHHQEYERLQEDQAEGLHSGGVFSGDCHKSWPEAEGCEKTAEGLQRVDHSDPVQLGPRLWLQAEGHREAGDGRIRSGWAVRLPREIARGSLATKLRSASTRTASELTPSREIAEGEPGLNDD